MAFSLVMRSGWGPEFYGANLFSVYSSQDYCASKFGAIGFHESLSHELKAAEKDGINMTLVCPYLVDTGMFKGCRIRLIPKPDVLSCLLVRIFLYLFNLDLINFQPEVITVNCLI